MLGRQWCGIWDWFLLIFSWGTKCFLSVGVWSTGDFVHNCKPNIWPGWFCWLSLRFGMCRVSGRSWSSSTEVDNCRPPDVLSHPWWRMAIVATKRGCRHCSCCFYSCHAYFCQLAHRAGASDIEAWWRCCSPCVQVDLTWQHHFVLAISLWLSCSICCDCQII